MPLRLKIRGSRGFKHALELVEELAKRLEWNEKKDFSETDYRLPEKSVEVLIEEGLIKVNGQAINTEALPTAEPPEHQVSESLGCEISNFSIVATSVFIVSPQVIVRVCSPTISALYCQ